MFDLLSRPGRICGAVAVAMLALSTIARASDNSGSMIAQDRPACGVRHLDASVAQAYPADYPEVARQEGATGTATVRVDLTDTGSVAQVSIVKSTGNGVLDGAALDAARNAQFTPEEQDCIKVSGSYLYLVTFP